MRRPEHFFGFSTSPVISRVFSDLSLSLEMKNRPRRLEPSLQFVLPHARLDMAGSTSRWTRELEREFPESGKALLGYDHWAAERSRASDGALVSDLAYPPVGFRAQARYKSTIAPFADMVRDEPAPPGGLSRLHPGHPVRAMALAPVMHLSGVQPRRLGALAPTRLWNHLRAGLYRLPDGIEGLKRLFIGKLKEQCGDHHPHAAVERVIFKRGKAREVLLADRGETLGCEFLVCNMDPRAFMQLLPDEGRTSRVTGTLEASHPIAWRFHLNVAVEPSVIPPAMGPELVTIADPSQPLTGANCVWISRPGHGPPDPQQGGRPGDGVLMLSAALPARGIAPTVGAASRLVDGMLTRVSELMPFVDAHTHCVHAPSLTVDRETGQPELDLTELVPIRSVPVPMTLGVGAVPMASGYKNVLLASDAAFAGLGFEGLFLGALQALHVTRQEVKLKRPLAP